MNLYEIIRKSRDKFRLLVDSSPLGIAITDKSGVITVANRSLADLVNIPVNELPSKNILNIFVKCIMHDEIVRPAESEMLRAICIVLDCPMPPLMTAA